jgi:hypothetical protein
MMLDILPRIPFLQLGDWELESWFAAPYPEECTRLPKLYICEFCLKYMKSSWSLVRHASHCHLSHPPGDEIYRDGPISIFEVDGRKNKVHSLLLSYISIDLLSKPLSHSQNLSRP